MMNHNMNPDYAVTQGWGTPGYGSGGGDDSTMDYCPGVGGGNNLQTSSSLPSTSLGTTSEERKMRNVLGSREPVKAFCTMRTILLDLKYTKRNLLLGVGKYSASGPVWSLDNQ